MAELSESLDVDPQWVAKLLKMLHDQQVKNAAQGLQERSLLMLHMQGGWSTEGWLLDFGSNLTSDNQPIVVIYPSSTSTGGSVVGMPLENIKAITILKAVEPAPATVSPLSVHDLEQSVKEIAQLLFNIIGKVIPGELVVGNLLVASYIPFEKQLKALYSGFMQILAFPVARNVFTHKIHAFKIQYDFEMSVQIQEGTLLITLPIDDLSLPDLIAAIVNAFA